MWPKSGFYPYGGFLGHGGTPSYHLFTDGFSTINYKLSILGYPHLWNPTFLDTEEPAEDEVGVLGPGAVVPLPMGLSFHKLGL